VELEDGRSRTSGPWPDAPIPDNDGKGFESFHAQDPNAFDLQISNANGLANARKTRATAKTSAPVALSNPFAPTGWSTVWLDHLSYNAANYKEAASFYSNLLGWKETYDEGSQHELMIGELGDIIIRGGNPNNPAPASPVSRGRIDHISFGIAPWDTDGVKAELEKRGLRARVDTSTKGRHPCSCFQELSHYHAQRLRSADQLRDAR
jgi:catechol 2,3-dioxygenase-like lactoylglutathione lyase family enzyme